MVDFMVKKMLRKYLGNIIEDDLKISTSLRSGEANLEGVLIKKDMFQQYGFPLEIIYGKISRMKIKVPYTSLSSEPVQVFLDGLDVVVRPITDMAKWDLKNLVKGTNLTEIELSINHYVWDKYEELKKSKE